MLPHEEMNVAHHFADELYAKECLLPKGFKCAKHMHSYSHLSILAKGRVTVTTETGSVEYCAHEKPVCILIEAGLVHEVSALEDSVWFCIHHTDEKSPEKVDRVLIERGV